MQELQIDEQKLLRLYAPWEEPDRHRQGGEIVEGRRPSQLAVPNALREHVSGWRELGYEGASDTSRILLTHWFGREHLLENREFRYYYCQREAIETLVYLYEVKKKRRVSDLVSEYGSDSPLEAILAAAGIPPIENEWPKYAFKLATGTGKTKCMSLAIVWSYFHALYEPNSEMTTRFLMIAPGLTVYERLLEDFEGGKIFDTDPLIPPAWKSDWHLNVIQQNEPGGAGDGVLYLTNIHKLYPNTRVGKQYHSFAGPWVKPNRSIDLAAELRERISKEPRLMILNDEAHHIWHPNLAWSKALQYFHDECDNIVAQLDFSATPKDRNNNPFKHIVCDTPLGEAVDSGIVKVPIIGEANLKEGPSENAAEKYQEHLVAGYKRWNESFKEWEKSGEKVLLFVMCENTREADEIANYLNSDPFFEKLNGKTLNLHTKLKGKINSQGEFVEDEKDMNPTDLRQLREFSRSLGSKDNPYVCIVSVLMLREGWDVKNVTTIVPLRPFTGSPILPEQTLGRGLRRMRPPITHEVVETVVVIEHPEFRKLYEDALGTEGVTPIVQSVSAIKSTVVHIYPEKNGELEIEFPRLSDAHSVNMKTLKGISRRDIEEQCAKIEMSRLSLDPLSSIEYRGIHMLTQEVVEWMKFEIPLLNNGWTAISYFVKMLKYRCRLSQDLHPIIAPLIEQFLTEILFGEKVLLTDPRLVQRLKDHDVSESILTVFVPLILKRVTQTYERRHFEAAPIRLSKWQPYEFTQSEQNPVVLADKTMFNWVACHRRFEEEFAEWLDRAEDVVAFAKNAGPQALRIDYLDVEGRIARYIPDFFVRDIDGNYFLVETKGFPDPNEKQKALAGHSWCQSASEASGVLWEYLFVHQTEWDLPGVRTLAELIPIATRIPS